MSWLQVVNSPQYDHPIGNDQSPRVDLRAALHPTTGGHTWWAHVELTRIDTTPTILRKEIEHMGGAGASTSIASPISIPLNR